MRRKKAGADGTRSAPPVLARVLRGGRVESVHRGAVAVVDAAGRRVARVGDDGHRVFIRSAGKPFQALPLLEAGGEKRFRLGDDEIALMCASHGGEPSHVRVAARLLARGGFSARDLGCGAQWPMHEGSAQALARRGLRPTPLHNNCSGKHAGLLLACRIYGFSPRGYLEPGHPIQKEVLRRVSDFSGVPAAKIPIGVDGCGLPVFFLPLAALARAYAGLVAKERPGESRFAAAVRRRVVRAMTASPAMVAGRGRFTTDFLRAGGGRWIGKEGAEGVYAVAIAPSEANRGRAAGVALKIEDGSTRARDAVTLAVLDRLGLLPRSARRSLAAHRAPEVRNARGEVVGSIETESFAIAAP